MRTAWQSSTSSAENDDRKRVERSTTARARTERSLGSVSAIGAVQVAIGALDPAKVSEETSLSIDELAHGSLEQIAARTITAPRPATP